MNKTTELLEIHSGKHKRNLKTKCYETPVILMFYNSLSRNNFKKGFKIMRENFSWNHPSCLRNLDYETESEFWKTHKNIHLSRDNRINQGSLQRNKPETLTKGENCAADESFKIHLSKKMCNWVLHQPLKMELYYIRIFLSIRITVQVCIGVTSWIVCPLWTGSSHTRKTRKKM